MGPKLQSRVVDLAVAEWRNCFDGSLHCQVHGEIVFVEGVDYGPVGRPEAESLELPRVGGCWKSVAGPRVAGGGLVGI